MKMAVKAKIETGGEIINLPEEYILRSRYTQSATGTAGLSRR
jgi:hypothetical protein